MQISGGSYESLAFLDADAAPTAKSFRTVKRESIFAAFASQAKKEAQAAARESQRVTPLIMCTGGFRTERGILQAIQEGGIDLVGLGRAAAVDLSLPAKLLAERLVADEDEQEQVACVDYTVTGGAWLQKLVPLKLVGASVTTLWHQLQMFRIARKETVRVQYSFERLLLLKLCTRWRVFLGMFGVVVLAILCY